MSGRSGFTLMDVLITIVLIAILAAMVAPRIQTAIQHARVNRAASVVAGDLELAFTMAARQRKPMRLTTSGAATYTIADRSGGTVRYTRNLGAGTDFNLSISFAPTTVDVFPTGVSTAVLTVTVGGTDFTRQLTMTRGGQVLLVPL
jgi:prepilin-type N-terminal cleavage/methylation domain-containing protein